MTMAGYLRAGDMLGVVGGDVVDVTGDSVLKVPLAVIERLLRDRRSSC